MRLIGDQEVTVDMLSQMDRLVQLIESPIFTFLRMEAWKISILQDLQPNYFSFLMGTQT